MRFEIRTPADVEAMLQHWGIADEAPKPPPEPEKKSSLQTADEMVAAVIESKDATRIYKQDLIDALGRAGTIKQYEAKYRLQTAFPKDMRVREWWARVKQAEGANFVKGGDGRYLLSTSGGMKPNLANAVTMMEDLPATFDLFAFKVVLAAPPPWRSTTGAWGDIDDGEAAVWCQKQNLDIPSHTAGEAARIVAQKNPVHPVQEYLNGLKWDGEPRLDMWLTVYLGVPDSPYARNVASKWMISGVNRVMEPGCQADYTLVLEGGQGKKKSSALRILGGEWFSDDLTDIGTKDASMQLQGIWIIEIAELDAFRKAEMTTIKAWLGRRVDHFRPPYGRHDMDFPRQNIFAASTNMERWGHDDTGLRRFWPVKTSEIDLTGLRKVRDQLWAEAKFRYDEGEKGFLVGEAEAVATKEQAERQDVDPWTDRITEWLQAPVAWIGADTDFRSSMQRIYTSDVLSHCLRLTARDVNRPSKDRVVRVLKLSGYESTRVPRQEVAPGGPRLEFYRRKPEAQ